MIEQILRLSIQQRLVVLIVTLGICILGVQSLLKLPIDAVPDITNNQVQINAVAPSLSPMEIEKQVTYPLENSLAGIPGLESTRSLSRNGFSQVTAIFSDKTNIYFARQQVAERLAEARELLPEGIEPRLGPISTGLGEVYMWLVRFKAEKGTVGSETGWQADGSYITAEGEKLDTEVKRATYLRTVQDWLVRPQLRNVTGVAGIDSIGGYVKEYHVQPKLDRLLAFGLTLNDLSDSIQRNNSAIGAGFLEQNGEGLVVRAYGRLESVEDIGNVVVATRDGVPVYVHDVATIDLGHELRSGAASSAGEEVVVGTALMLIGGNSRTVADAVHVKLAEVNRSLPPGVEAAAVLNRTKLVDATVATVEKNLAEGALLVIVVLFLFLGNIRAAIITALVIPITMLMTATGMLQGRISANLMSLGALDFGLIVDGAVIITENCLRHLADKQHELRRALTRRERLTEVMVASKEMIQPSVFGQAIIIIVYVPMLSFTGVEGKMFEPMALTVIIALACAFVLSLTFVPAMIALFVTGPVKEKESRFMVAAQDRYGALLNRVVGIPGRIAAVAAAMFFGSLLLLTQLGQEFIPTLDEKDIAMHAMRIPSTSLNQSAAMQNQVEKTVARFPEVATVFSKTGTAEVASDPMPPNVSDTFIILKPQQEWPDPDKTKVQLIREIEQAVGRVPGNNYEFTQPIQMRFNELIAGVRSDVAVKVYGDDFDTLLETANAVAAVLRGVDGASDVKVEQAAGLPYLNIRLKKREIARRGLSVAQVQQVIATAIGGHEAGALYEGDKRFDIVVRLADTVRSDLEVLHNLPVPLPGNGRLATIPLRQLADIEIDEGPNQISRENGKRRIVVQANVRGRDIGSMVRDAQAQISARVTLPPGYWIAWGGQYENLIAAKNRLLVVVPLCFAAIFFLLFMALGSVRDALIVYSGIPFALVGGILALTLRGMPISVSAIVGFIALSGIAVLNGLVMVSRIQQEMAEGVDRVAAVIDGAVARLRPVLITALVASLGFVPMAIALGTGAEVQKPIATVVIGGLISSTLLTLLVLPALYARFGTGRQTSDDELDLIVTHQRHATAGE
ncbi:CusA/CzcA family heavy metal efflux RND transporter [Ferrovibrio sp. MS7]|uniref:efflux RND transporter permease subunit n=1 Tax=Ferrovibrio plantarum TaxID=3119164 RepID=UPI0031351E54